MADSEDERAGNTGDGDDEAVGDRKSLEQRLKSALWYHVGKTVDAETMSLNFSASPQFIGSLTELVWTQIENTALDLESFAKHGKRNVVKTEDVLLLARRNEGLEEILKGFVEGLEKKKEGGKDGGDGQGKGRKKRTGKDRG